MIPDSKKDALNEALNATFGTTNYNALEPITKGLSGALIFKLTVHDQPFLLRIVTRDDAFGDPLYYFSCMETVAEAGLAPKVHYLSIKDRISITGFIDAHPFPALRAFQQMPSLLRKLHHLPKFPFRINYFESMERQLSAFLKKEILPEKNTRKILDIYERIKAVYPFQDHENWVSSHNDCKPENILFDGIKPWLVDWEAGFLNDRYLDLAIVGNFLVGSREEKENEFLTNYFEDTPSEDQRARYFLMSELLHLYYFVLFLTHDQLALPLKINRVAVRGFESFHQNLWDGNISLGEKATKREYAVLHYEAFLRKNQNPRFKESINRLARIAT